MNKNKEFIDNLITDILKAKHQQIECNIKIMITKEDIEKINKYIKKRGITLHRLMSALLREYAEDKETRSECLKHMPMEYTPKCVSPKVLHMSRDFFNLLALESKKISIDKAAMLRTLILLCVNEKVKFKSDEVISAIIFERII